MPLDLDIRQRRPGGGQRILRSRGTPIFGPGGERLLLRAGLGWPPEQIGSREAEVGRASHAGFTLLIVIALARELLTNAAKHADASRVRVERTADAILLEVADDGHGIPEGRLASAPREGHIGLGSSIQRVEAVGGTLTLSPAPGGGTTVAVKLPA